MHRIIALSGGWNPQSEGVFFLEQTPAPLVFITAADTDIQTLAAAVAKLPATFSAFRVANLLQLQQQISIDSYAEQVLERASVIILRLLGGRSYWTYGLEVVEEIVQRNGTTLIVMPGDDALDPDLMSHSTLPLSKVNQIWRYFNEGGIENIVNALLYISDTCLLTSFHPKPPLAIPRVGLYEWEAQSPIPNPQSPIPKVGILFYRAHYLAGNTKVIDALCAALAKQNLEPLPVFVSSLREPDVTAKLCELIQPQDSPQIALLINTTSFSLARLDADTPQTELWQKLDVPVLQAINSSGSVEQWELGLQGLSPRDIAMNVALPEVDGRIISRAISFKALQSSNSSLETDVVIYEPENSRVEFVAQLAANWVRLRNKPPHERRVALILANYPSRDGRLANGVGLDTPASCVEILQALQESGYGVVDLPKDGNDLIECLQAGVTNDPEGGDLRLVRQCVSLAEYQEYFASLPEEVRRDVDERWGGVFDLNRKDAKGTKEETEGEDVYFPFSQTPLVPFSFPISGVQFGNVFVGVQPSRGYDVDPSLNYHAPDLEPTHGYLAFYFWVRECFGADAVIHVGKHGNLEWLPGKSVALSDTCFPEVALGALPHLYPFIVNDPGEGSQAKRRAQAVILDHLTPPLTRAELYGSLQKLENLIDEYYEALSLDPSRLSVVCSRIQQLVIEENLHRDLGLEIEQTEFSIQNFLGRADGYLCELKEAQIRDGLHVFGVCPSGRQLRDLIVAIARHPNRYHTGITRALAFDWGLDFDPLTEDFGTELSASDVQILADKQERICRTVGDAVEVLEEFAAGLVEQIIHDLGKKDAPPGRLYVCLDWIGSTLLPALQQTDEEITNLLRGLDGRYIPSAPAGAPTRGRPEVLPTGKNFYSVDIRAIPTESAWSVGRNAAETLIENYTQEHGEYPKTLALSVWGTATMRTGGDDIAEALALLGVQPVWDGVARRVVDFEVLPLSILGRPRVDVTLRISGFFRDAFPNLIDLFDRAVAKVAALDEPPEQNPLSAQVREETQLWTRLGLSLEQATVRSHYRIFGSKPGAYGAGLQGLMESQNWTDDQDLAAAYINWSCYAYCAQSGEPVREGVGEKISPVPPSSLGGQPALLAFKQRLQSLQIVLHNQDNREHDLLDSDDYYQFQGGLTAAVRAFGGNPQTYFGDNSIPAKPRVRQLKEEIARVYRSRVINPKWIAGVMRHGYKGAFEMSATVDYLFAYDATAKCVEDHMYQGVAQAYLFDSVVSSFILENNPHALRDISERLLEAHKRGLWEDVNIQTLENLRSLVHQAEAVIEGK
ncbi:cobaltochelatase subunit CobN [Iningainema tapete]|uniref:Cobaltochelatase subunit CobN n=1 Tax=Iningainema tapete BLCC-T55 TaxID=2748662 RepID=A0A8J6XKG0_9CYAN|nr:cobaltochelatase subunit CobN [Iningainema tapete]MBD2776303.1 cobaltochelatase subunit CobN [Iningainema tapete BLCC-T55]